MPVTIPSGRRRPPVVPADRTTGSTGSTHGDTAVAAPAIRAKSASRTIGIEVFYERGLVTDVRVEQALTDAECLIASHQAAQERLDHDRVELRAGALLELRAGPQVPDSRAVRPIGSHRLVGI